MSDPKPYDAKCPACGAKPGRECFGNGPMSTPHTIRGRQAWKDEVARLRADLAAEKAQRLRAEEGHVLTQQALAAVTAERDRLRESGEALYSFAVSGVTVTERQEQWRSRAVERWDRVFLKDAARAEDDYTGGVWPLADPPAHVRVNRRRASEPDCKGRRLYSLGVRVYCPVTGQHRGDLRFPGSTPERAEHRAAITLGPLVPMVRGLRMDPTVVVDRSDEGDG